MLDPNLLKKIHYQSWHRGTKESDLVFGRFADKYLDQLSESEIKEFAEILETSDAILMDWVQGRASPPTAFQLIHKIKAFVEEAQS